MHRIPALRGLSQEGGKLEASLGYMVKQSLNKIKREQREQRQTEEEEREAWGERRGNSKDDTLKVFQQQGR